MNEIQVIVNQQPGEIRFNYEDIKLTLQEKLSIYKDAVVTEDGKTIAKKEVASLRRLKKEMDDRRKNVKKEWNEPYEEFNSKVQTLLSMIDEPILLIDSQVKAFDKKQKQEKKTKIKALYEELIGDIREYLTFEKVYLQSWENTSTSMKKVQEELQARIDSVQKDIFAIRSIQSEAVPKALEMYKDSMDAMSSVQYINNYERQKQEILEREQRRKEEEEERRRQAEIARIRAEERARIEEEEPAEMIPEAAAEDEELPFEQPSTRTVFYKVVATEEELEQVEMAFNSIGIYFSRRDAS